MASGLNIDDNMFYVRETPWHGLGVRVEEALDSQEALEKSGLNWMVEQRPMYIPDGNGGFTKVDNALANVRSDTNKVLGTVKSRYSIVQNQPAFEWTDKLIGDDVRYETAGSLHSGKKVFLLARLPDCYVVGDKTEIYLVFTNSHDGSSAVRTAITPVRVVCQNTLNLALGSAKRQWSARHTGNMDNKMDEARRAMEMTEIYMQNFNKTAEALAMQKVSINQFQTLVCELFPMPEQKVENGKVVNEKQIENAVSNRQELSYRYLAAPDLANFQGTAWGIVNAVSDFATHRVPQRQTANSKENLFMDVVDGNALIDSAYDILAKIA